MCVGKAVKGGGDDAVDSDDSCLTVLWPTIDVKSLVDTHIRRLRAPRELAGPDHFLEEADMPNEKRPSVKDDEQYERLRQQGMSKEKAARIANTPRKQAGKRGGKSSKYEEWSKEELYEKAKDVGIEGRSNMSKKELINALRNH